jgi:hypothetical protein
MTATPHSETASQQSAPRSWPAPARAILVGGLLAGTIDIGAACLINHRGPSLILKVIASGLFGSAALQGGAQMVAIGLLLQWAMSLVIAAVFGAGAGLLRWPSSRWILGGLVYGPIIFVVMSFVVVPLSAAVVKQGPAPTPAAIVENLLAMVVFGLIVSATWAWSQRRPATAA